MPIQSCLDTKSFLLVNALKACRARVLLSVSAKCIAKAKPSSSLVDLDLN